MVWPPNHRRGTGGSSWDCVGHKGGVVIRFVCLHGNFGSPSDWAPVEAALNERLGGVTCECADLWALDRVRWRQELEHHIVAGRRPGELTYVLGYSLGARLVLEVFERLTPSIDGLILCSVNPGISDEGERARRRAADAEWSRRLTDPNQSWCDIVAAWEAQPVFAGSMPRLKGAFRSQAEEARYRAIVGARFVDWSPGTLRSHWETVRHLTTPLLCLAGERDRAYVERLRTIGALGNPHIRTVVVPASSHRFPFEEPTTLAASVAEFVGQRANAPECK